MAGVTPHQFLDSLIQFIAVCGGRVTSYGRDWEGNRHVGGVERSAHLVWLAADVAYTTRLPLEARREWAERLGLRLLEEPDHDHLQPLDWKAG